MNGTISTNRWSLDYTTRPSLKNGNSIPNPPGFVATSKNSNKSATIIPPPSKTVDLVKLREQKAWEVAIAPAKNVPMQAFMMYMTGGGIQIFSMMSIWFLLKGAVGGIMSVNNSFAPFISPPSLSTSTSPPSTAPPFLLQKSVFIICQIALLAVGLWKVNSMGLLPINEIDWSQVRDVIPW